MTGFDIAHLRQHNQRLVGTSFEKPDEVVRWLGAVQAQEYAGAKWGVAQRTNGVREAVLDQAFAEGSILRTHVMRPTWHFVTPEDLRWMLKLTAPRVHAANAFMYRKMELDSSVFVQSSDILAKALQGGNQLMRSELGSLLQQAGLITAAADRFRLAYIMMHAELDGVICSGALRGRQHTYALLDERAPQARALERDEALAELTMRFFTSHGPATLKDYAWWSGLSLSEARAGVEMIKPQLIVEVLDGRSYWFSPNMPAPKMTSPAVHLLPVYDEYTIAYKDPSNVLDLQFLQRVISGNGFVIVIDGRIAGTWKRTFKKGAVVIELRPFTSLKDAENQAVAAAAGQYGVFLDMQVILA